MWPFKTTGATVPDDVGEAQSSRNDADAQIARAEGRAPLVSQLAEFLAERRRQNHFGESIQITFTRRST